MHKLFFQCVYSNLNLQKYLNTLVATMKRKLHVFVIKCMAYALLLGRNKGKCLRFNATIITREKRVTD